MERTPNQKKAYTTPTLKVVEFKIEKGFAESSQPAIPTKVIFSDNSNVLESYNTKDQQGNEYTFDW